MISRRPPTFIGATLPVPPMPCVKPGTTPVSGKLIGLAPRAHDESKTLPFFSSAPTYWTCTVEVGVAAAPLPTTRSMHSSALGAAATLAVMTGACLRFVAFFTVTPPKLAVSPLAGLSQAAGLPTGVVDGLGDGEGE